MLNTPQLTSRRRPIVFLTASAIALVTSTVALRAEAFVDKDCSDFSYQQDAQAVLNADRSDPHRLDANHDGVACESLPSRPASTPPTPQPMVPTRSSSSYLVDWTADAVADLVAITPSGALVVYPGTGTGRFRTARTIATGWQSTSLVTQAADFDGDRTADLVARRGSYLMLFGGNGRGGLTRPRVIGAGWAGIRALLGPVDVTGDGKPDLIAIRTFDDSMWVYPGTGRGTLGRAYQLGLNARTLTSVSSAGDLTGDHKPDLIAIFHGQLRIYPGTGRGGFAAARAMSGQWNGVQAMTVPGNVVGDRAGTDLAVVQRDGTLHLYPGFRSGGLSTTGVTVGRGWGTLRFAGDTTRVLPPPTPPRPIPSVSTTPTPASSTMPLQPEPSATAPSRTAHLAASPS